MIPLFKVFMSPTASKAVATTLNSGFITQGPRVEEFEKELRNYFNHPYILTVNAATSGLTLALRLLKDDLKLTSEDQVLCTPLTCTATNWPVLANNLRIKWVDVDPQTCNMDLDDLERKITRQTKVILLVHWGGTPIDLDKLKQIQKSTYDKFGFEPKIIEDCAHSFGAVHKNKFVGASGNISVFSLQAIKHLTTGDGGLIFLPNERQFEKVKLLRWYGISREQRSKGDFRLEADVRDWGYKFHMNDINATIGIENLKYMDENLQKIRANAQYYFDNLKGVEFMKVGPNVESAWWIFTIKVDSKLTFIEYMKQRGVVVSQVHNRNDNHSCVSQFKTTLPNLDELEKKIVSIPVGWWLTEEQLKKIVHLINEY